ncbi:MAG: hypothetical protein AAGF77_06065 [Bacteroidota bacterium]
MENDNDQEYKGPWMTIGCLLSALAIIGVLTVIGLFVFNLLRGS